MEPNKINQVVEVLETEDLNEVNDRLNHGWMLLLSYTYAPYQSEPANLRAVYSLGRLPG